MTECLPTVLPLRVIKKLILLFWRFPFLFKKIFTFNLSKFLRLPYATAYASIRAVPDG